MAVYLSPQARTWPEDSKGYVVLVDRNGDYRPIKTSGMDIGKLIWDESGLHFSDVDFDYVVGGDGMRRSTSPKQNYQLGMVRTRSGEIISTYNSGFTEDGFLTELVRVNGKDSKKVAREGNIALTAACGSEVYGVAEATAEFKKKYPASDPRFGRQMLYRLWPGEQKAVGALDGHLSEVWYKNDAPCRAHNLYHLIEVYPEGRSDGVGWDSKIGVALARWDISTGKMTETALLSSGGSPVEMTKSDFSYSSYGSSWLVGHRLYWLGGDGDLRATNVLSGETNVQFSTTSISDGASKFEAFVSGGNLHVVDIPSDSKCCLSLSTYDMSTGARRKVLEVDDVNQKTNVNLEIRGAAVAPGYLGD